MSDIEIPGVISEAEAAKEKPIDGEAVANARAKAHRSQKYASSDTPVISEAEAVKEPADAAEKTSNARAAELRSESFKDGLDAHIVTEADVVAKVPDAEPEPVKPKRTTENKKPRTTRAK